LCDGGTGACGVVNQDGADCDDGDLCTEGDSCDQGVCAAGTPKDCSAEDGECQTGVCDAAGACVAEPKAQGLSCDDGSVCTDGDTCDDAGVCTSGTDVVCDDGNPCTDDTVCDAAQGCTYPVLDGADCDDGVGCTVGDTCDAAGTCGGTADDSECDNGLYCDGLETCDAVAGCLSGTPEPCGAIGGLCVEGVCKEEPDGASCVVQNLEDVPCDDGDGCTYDDTCGGGACVGTALDPCPFNDPNLLCTGSGEAGEQFYCEIHALRACEDVPYTGTLQWYLSWDPAQVTLLGFTDRTQDPNVWPATYLYGVDPLPGYMPTAESGIFGPVAIHKYTATTPAGDGTWDGEMNIAVYTETNGLIACEPPLPVDEQCTSPIVDAYKDASGDSVGESLIFHAHFALASSIPEATPAGVSFTEVIANDPLLQNFTPTLDGGVTLLDYEDS
ncbi:MAG: hypothetical protein VX938_13585, partial [Myxococcota bacterium]|nr:hypothetical protein [Myxococcota bacterium]